MRITRLALDAPGDQLGQLRAFYEKGLGFEVADTGSDGLSLVVGEAELVFSRAGGAPFYHFALLVPDGRFDAACRWVTQAVKPLEGRDGNTTFDFSDWDARALYFLDPAGNIIEIICHTGLAGGGKHADAPFEAAELAGISEAALITADPAQKAREIEAETGIPVWDGDPGAGIVFAGERGRTLVISRTGRGLMPTRRPGEEHPLTAAIERDDGSTVVVGTA